MKTPRPFYRIAMTLGVVATIAACGSDKKKAPAAAAPAPEAISATVDGVDQLPSGGAKVRYSSKPASASTHYKCQTEIAGKASDWADCPADGAAVPPQAGLIGFRVKAITAAGAESAAAFTQIAGSASGTGAAPGSGSVAAPGPSGTPVNTAVSTQIQNKGDVGATYAKSSLTLRLGVKGDGVNMEKVRFECKREGADATFKKCDSGDQPQYVFDQMMNDASYSLEVRAVLTDTNTIAASDSISFKIALAKLAIGNAADLNKDGNADVSLTLDRSGLANARLQCTMDAAQAADCPAGANGTILVERSRLTPGSHSLKIVAVDNNGGQLGDSMLTFCVGSCSAQNGPQAPIVKNFQIGSFYDYLVPDDMHVTEYATTKTYNGALSFYRITPESDPFYLGIYKCDGAFDTRMTAARPDGKGYNDYCQSTPQRDLYKWLTDYRLANNHLEVATNQELINNFNQEKILINVFDADYEYMVGRSRFEQLCLNQHGTITKTAQPIRFEDNDFWGEPVRADFYMCVTAIAGVGPGSFPMSGEKWWVGAFFIHNDNANFPLYECYTQQDSPAGSYDSKSYDLSVYDGKYKPSFCGSFKNPHVLEVVYMTRTPYMSPWDFARAAQTRFRHNLFDVIPSH